MNQRSTSIDVYCSIYSAHLWGHVSTSYISTNSVSKNMQRVWIQLPRIYINHCKPRRNGSMVNCRNWMKLDQNWFLTKSKVDRIRLVNRGDSLLTLWSRECEISGFGTQLSWLIFWRGGTFQQIQSREFSCKIMGNSWKLLVSITETQGWIRIPSNLNFVTHCNTSSPTKGWKKIQQFS